MNETVLEPLRMKHSFYQQPLAKELEANAAAGHRFNGEMLKGKWTILPEMAAGGLWSTPSDLALFVLELQKEAAGKSKKILSADTITQMLTPQIANMGLGITVEGQGEFLHFSHGGSNPGYRAFMVGYAKTGQGAVIMTNSDMGNELAMEILRGIAKEYAWHDYHPDVHEVVKVDPKVFETYVGQYEYAPGRTITVTTENGRIFAQETREYKSEIFPESATSFFSILYNTKFQFVFDEKGRVTGLTARWAGDETEYKAKKSS
jgi:CubicO group peptidase (beta-lactamase class C family)